MFSKKDKVVFVIFTLTLLPLLYFTTWKGILGIIYGMSFMAYLLLTINPMLLTVLGMGSEIFNFKELLNDDKKE